MSRRVQVETTALFVALGYVGAGVEGAVALLAFSLVCVAIGEVMP